MQARSVIIQLQLWYILSFSVWIAIACRRRKRNKIDGRRWGIELVLSDCISVQFSSTLSWWVLINVKWIDKTNKERNHEENRKKEWKKNKRNEVNSSSSSLCVDVEEDLFGMKMSSHNFHLWIYKIAEIFLILKLMHEKSFWSYWSRK